MDINKIIYFSKGRHTPTNEELFKTVCSIIANDGFNEVQAVDLYNYLKPDPHPQIATTVEFLWQCTDQESKQGMTHPQLAYIYSTGKELQALNGEIAAWYDDIPIYPKGYYDDRMNSVTDTLDMPPTIVSAIAGYKYSADVEHTFDVADSTLTVHQRTGDLYYEIGGAYYNKQYVDLAMNGAESILMLLQHNHVESSPIIMQNNLGVNVLIMPATLSK